MACKVHKELNHNWVGYIHMPKVFITLISGMIYLSGCDFLEDCIVCELVLCKLVVPEPTTRDISTAASLYFRAMGMYQSFPD